MDQVAGKISKNQDDSPVVCKPPALPHLSHPGGAVEGLTSPTSPTKVSDTSETSSIPSSESYRHKRPDDSPGLYRKFESAVIEYVTKDPGRGSAEYDRLRGEMYAACEPSYIRKCIMYRLLSKPLDYTGVSLDGVITWDSALHWAALLGSAVICDILLSSGKCLDVNRRNLYDRTPLMNTFLSRNLTPTEKKLSDDAGVVRHLISHRANLHAKDKFGKTALQLALDSGRHDCAKVLLQAGCSISDLTDAQKGGAISRMIQDQARDASKYMDKLKKLRGQSKNPGPQSPVQVTINLLGDSEAGKSSVAASLENKRPIRVDKSDRTVGAKVNRMHLDGIEFLVYDFGGHPSYAFLHHLYLPQFGIHVIFIKVDRQFDAEDCSRQLNRWMYFLSAKIPGPRVLVVLSKVDLLSKEELGKAVRGLQMKLRLMEEGEHEVLDAWLRSNESDLSSLQSEGKKLPGYETIKKNLADAEILKRLQPKMMGGVLCVSCEEGKEEGLDDLLERCSAEVKEGSQQFFRLSEFPESWEIFHKALMQCRGNGRLAIPMSEVCQMAEAAGVLEKDVKTCLFLFKATGHILHYEHSEQALNQYVFQDPELLAKSMGKLVHHDIKDQFKSYITSVPSMPEGDSIRSDFENGWLPYQFIKLQLTEGYQSEGDKFAGAVVQLARHIGLCISVDKRKSQGRHMVFVPSLVTRSRSDVDLRMKWGPDNMHGWDDFVMDLRLHKGLPIGFVERVNVEAAPFTSGNVNFLNGFFAKGWNDCLLLLEEVPVAESSSKFSRLHFKFRAESSNRDAAILNMTWLYSVFQTVLSYYPGVLAHAVTPCKCADKVYDVKGCLDQSYEVLKNIKCSVCPSWEHRSAADVFPVNIPEPADALSSAKQTGEATSHSEAPREESGVDVDSSDIYISKCDPKDSGRFAFLFGEKVKKDKVADLASYISESSEHLFGRTVLTADELTDYEDGKKRGRHLIAKLKERGVIYPLPDGVFNYSGLVKILFGVNLRQLCGELLQKQAK